MTTEFKETLAAAVEVIAKALNEAVGGRPENWFVWVEDAKAALESALPILRAQFAEEVDRAIDEIVADINDTDRIRDRDLLIRIRAAIARNWETK